jgi:hypothetical protein
MGVLDVAFPARREYRYLNGSRNVILEKSTGGGFYGSDEFRYRAVESVELHKGEILYFEIVGSLADGRPIMEAQPIKEELKHLIKQYGSTMTYNYGQPAGTQGVYVYKIVHMNEDGYGVELSWPQMVQRCGELGLKHAPLLAGPFTLKADRPLTGYDELKALIDDLTEGPSTLDPTHIREGVVLRVESPEGTQHIKNKSWTFGVLEGYIKDLDTYVDAEEAA